MSNMSGLRRRHVTVLIVLLVSPCLLSKEITYNNVMDSAKKLSQSYRDSGDSGDTGSLTFHEETKTNLLNTRTFMETFLSSFRAEGVLENLGVEGVSTLCTSHLNETLIALVDGESWATQMIDADAKIPSGFLQGDILWTGNYDECIAVTATVYAGPNKTLPHQPFTGQYCKLGIPITDTAPAATDIGGGSVPFGELLLGFCLPSSCTKDDLLYMVNSLLGNIKLQNQTLQADNSSAGCQIVDLEYDGRAIASITFFSILAFIIVLATIYDVLFIHKLHQSPPAPEPEKSKEETAPLLAEANGIESNNVHVDIHGYGAAGEGHADKKHIQEQSQPGIFIRLLLAFSLYTNGSKILSTKRQPGNLGCLNGIRFISMSWVIMGHAFTFGMYQSRNALPFIQSHVSRWTFLVLLNATVSVDTFFILSGLLVSYLSLKELKKVGGIKNFCWGMFYFHRFWRLTPGYGLVMFLYIPLVRYLYNGPFWNQDGPERDFCATTWWKNLLYINNWGNMADSDCMGWGWYLANDMQFYVISPIFLIPLYYSNIIGVIVCGVFLLACWICTAVISVNENLPMTLLGAGGAADATQEYFTDYYVKPYTRIGPYIVGMFVGFILYKTECRKLLTWAQSLIGWALAAICCLSVIYGNYDTIRGVHVPSKGETALYTSTHSSIWAFGVGWVMYACATGTDIFFVNKFLSWSLFIPLSRLTYMAYLIHPVVLEIYFGGKQQPIYLTDMECTSFFLSCLVISNATAFVLSLAFESPFMGLEKVLFKRERKH